MNGLFLPITFTVLGLIVALSAYRGMRRGGARFYTLEREALLRRAGFSLMASVVLFLAAVSLLIYQRQQSAPVGAAGAGETEAGVIDGTPTPELDQFPPLDTLTPTPDFTIPTPTATPVICRAVVEGTSGNGLTLRDAPGGGEVAILAEGSILTMMEEAPVNANGLEWRKVRSIFGEEGWVAAQYLKIGATCE
ncbi:MAG: SH3 domain-containing protein [Anaerolineae bacterium]